MYIRSDIKPSITWWFCWRHVVFYFAYSLIIFVGFHKLGWKLLSIPFLPVGTIGTAVAFYVGFKNNASYERLWEGRKIWASIADLCRALGVVVASNSDIRPEVKETLIRRQISWCRLLSLQLREKSALRHGDKVPPEVALVRKIYGEKLPTETVATFLQNGILEGDRQRIGNLLNPALGLLELQTKDAMELTGDSEKAAAGRDRIMEISIECIKEQGATERLKNFPFPRQYAYFSSIFVWIFLILLPFGLLDEVTKVTSFDWLVVPFSTLISWMFITMEQVGDSSEDPFEMGLNDVAMTAICRNVEIELLGMLGVNELPPQLMAVGDILL